MRETTAASLIALFAMACTNDTPSTGLGDAGSGGAACADTRTVDGYYCCCGQLTCSRLPCLHSVIGASTALPTGNERGSGGTREGGAAAEAGRAQCIGAGGSGGDIPDAATGLSTGGSGGDAADASAGSNLVCALASWSIARDPSCPKVDFSVPDLTFCSVISGCARQSISAPGCCLPNGRCGGASSGASELLPYGCHSYADFGSIWMVSGVPSDPNISCNYPSDASSGNDSGTSSPGASCQPIPPSCNGLKADCGPSSDENCCVSPVVTGGSFGALGAGSISTFRLDKYEITVGRFRKFVDAVDAGWRPAQGSGKHIHLNGGKGLADSQGGGSYEPGWIRTWTTELPRTREAWTAALAEPDYPDEIPTWTDVPGKNENKPINFLLWHEAYAFCIWDGGFLPSQAEWTYAASGGREHRAYPWSTPGDTRTIDCTYANYSNDVRNDVAYGYCTPPGTVRKVGLAPKGNGRYGQADLAGNVWEYALDGYDISGGAYVFPSCSDCVCLSQCHPELRPSLGGSWADSACEVLVHPVSTNSENALVRDDTAGARCARSP